jgi:hypothetical protein
MRRYQRNETRISDARRADVTGVGAWEPSCRGFGIARIRRKRQLHPRQGCHPVDVGLNPCTWIRRQSYFAEDGSMRSTLCF